MADVDDLIARAKPREVTIPICLAGDLNAQHEDLSRQLVAARGSGEQWIPNSLSERNPQLEIAEQITALEREMSEQTHVFRCRALPPAKFRELQRAHPPREDAPITERFNLDSFPAALIAASCVDPSFPSAEKVSELFDRLGQGAFDAVFGAAWEACNGQPTVPKSALASVTIRSTAQN
jgi:hypothetical protein